MHLFNRSRLLALCATTTLLIAGASSALAADDVVRVRGTVSSFADGQLQVKSREGAPVSVKITDDAHVSTVVKAQVGDIKPGDYVGAASLPKADGGDGALEVLILPPQLKGLGEGHYPWDLKPKSSMTNATVDNAVKSVDGSTLTLVYTDKSNNSKQEKKISVANGTPIVKLAPATSADLVPGAVVFVLAKKGADGSLGSNQVIVGKNGVVPPM